MSMYNKTSKNRNYADYDDFDRSPVGSINRALKEGATAQELHDAMKARVLEAVGPAIALQVFAWCDTAPDRTYCIWLEDTPATTMPLVLFEHIKDALDEAIFNNSYDRLARPRPTLFESYSFMHRAIEEYCLSVMALRKISYWWKSP